MAKEDEKVRRKRSAMTRRYTARRNLWEVASICLMVLLPLWSFLGCRHVAGPPGIAKQQGPLPMDGVECTLDQFPPEIKESLKGYWIMRNPIISSHELRDKDGKKVWIIEGEIGEDIRIVFSGGTKVLALDYDRQIIPI